MAEALVAIDGRDDPLRIRINGPDATFVLGTELIRAKALASIEPHLEDLLDVACTVFSVDSSLSRGGSTRSGMGAGWHRGMHFTIPVRCPEIWQRPEVVRALVDAIGFLTGDHVSFTFTPMVEVATHGGVIAPFLDLDPIGATFDAEEVILFSGGLDSFAGALETLSTTSGKVILLSHRSAQKVIPRQERLGEYLTQRFPGRVLHIQVTARRKGDHGQETTQRSRSFLFAALGQTVARTFGARRLSLYENGIVSCNLPISPQVVGTMATRTTHPFAVTLLNDLMQTVDDAMMPLVNGYEWMTKTEVVERIRRHDGLKHLSTAVSCTSVHDQTILNTHCGACSQCLDRRFAVLAAGIEAYDSEDMYATDLLTGAREKPHSRTMAVEWTRHALRLEDLDERQFLQAFGLELVRLVRGFPDLAKADALRRLLDLHQRHAGTVRRVLEKSIHEYAGDLARGTLPETSLLRLHLGTQSQGGLPDDPRRDAQPQMHGAVEAGDTDTPSEDEEGLVAAIFEENGVKVVAIRNLGRVTGQPAVPAHFLKPTFDEDRANGLLRSEHRYVQQLPEDMNKDAYRKNVSRCRKELAGFFEDIHGHPPPDHLVIEGRQGKGYRLDPALRLSDPEGRG